MSDVEYFLKQIDEYADDSKHHSDQTWASNKNETQLTILATVFSAANLIRFPQACYINGGSNNTQDVIRENSLCPICWYCFQSSSSSSTVS